MSGQRGQVWKRGDKDWVVRYRAGEGREAPRRQKGRFKTKGEADRYLEARLRAIRTGLVDPPTFDDLVRDYFAQYTKSKSRRESLQWAVGKAQARFGRLPVDRLNAKDLGAFRHELPEASRHPVIAGVRQVLEQAVRWKMIAENPARDVDNPLPRRGEVSFLEDWAMAEKLAAELGEWTPIVVVAVGTGMMPQEWSALERRDVDLKERVVTVRRFVVDGKVSTLGKTERRRRRIPLRARVVDAIQAIPPRLDTRLLFPALRGGYLNVDNWRAREWTSAVAACGLDGLTPYSMRHTYAAWSIAAGVDIFTLSRRMGTSVEMIDRTYGHLLPSGEEHERFILDEWDGKHVARARGDSGGQRVDIGPGGADA